MGGETKFINTVNAITPGVISKLERGQLAPLPSDCEIHIAISDAPSLLYNRRTFGHADAARTWGEMVWQVCYKIEQLLAAGRNGVSIFFDHASPHNKSVSRRGNENTTPKTPYLEENGVEKQVSLTESMENWKRWLSEQVQIHDDAHAGMDPVQVRSNMNNFPLPLDTEELKAARELDPTIPDFSFQKYLQNKGYKTLLVDFVCQNLLERVTVGPGKWVMLISRKYHGLKENGEIKTSWDPRWNIPYFEADQVIPRFPSVIGNSEQEHLDKRPKINWEIYSIDADLLNAFLETSPTRISPTTRKFRNRVSLIRGQWSGYANTVIDINAYYQSIINMTSAMTKVVWNEPVLVFVMVHMLSGGNDYIDIRRRPQLGFKTLIETFCKHGSAFAENLIRVCYQHDPKTGEKCFREIIVHPEILGRFLICAWKVKFPKVAVHPNNVNGSLSILKGSGNATLQTGFFPNTLEDIAPLAATLSWTLTYFASAAYGIDVPDPFARYQGLSIWGFEKNTIDVDKFGHANAEWSTRVHTNHLIERWQQPDIDLRKFKAKSPPPGPSHSKDSSKSPSPKSKETTAQAVFNPNSSQGNPSTPAAQPSSANPAPPASLASKSGISNPGGFIIPLPFGKI